MKSQYLKLIGLLNEYLVDSFNSFCKINERVKLNLDFFTIHLSYNVPITNQIEYEFIYKNIINKKN